MKKGFGWFFIVLGVLNLLRGFATFSSEPHYAGGILTFGIFILVLGIWMVTSKSKTNKKDF